MGARRFRVLLEQEDKVVDFPTCELQRSSSFSELEVSFDFCRLGS